MNPLDRIQSYYDDFTSTDKELAIYFINNPHEVVTKNTDYISKETKTSKAAISRFCQKIGYSGFSEFRYDLSRFLVSRNDETSIEIEHKNAIESISDLYVNYINQLNNYLNDEVLQNLSKDFLEAKKIKIIGLNRSFNSANQFKQRLNRLGYDCEAINDIQGINDVMNLINKEYFIIMFTTTDNMHFYSPLINSLDKNGGKLVCITMNQNLTFKKKCDYFITLPRISKDSSMSFLDDQPLFMVFIEILLNYIVKANS